MSTARAQVATPDGGCTDYSIFYDRRTGMPHPYHIIVSEERTGDHRVQVFDCTPLSELVKAVAAQIKVIPQALQLFLDGRRLAGPRDKLGVLGVTPEAALTARVVGGHSVRVSEGGTRSWKLRGVEENSTKDPALHAEGKSRRGSVWDGMVSKRGSIDASEPGTTQPRRRRKNQALIRTPHIYSCYKNKGPISPTTQCQLYPVTPPPKPEVQIEFGDAGLYFRREQNWKPRNFGKHERRFSYTMERKLPLKNRYTLARHPSTRPWETPWEYHLTNRHQVWLQGSLVPKYDVFTDPHCSEFAQRLYNHVEEEHLEETLHDFYKRQEEVNSNSFNRARRRSIQLIEQVEGKLNQQTESSRRKSVCDDDDGPMDHAAAAREATARWQQQQQQNGNELGGTLYRAPTPAPESLHGPLGKPMNATV